MKVIFKHDYLRAFSLMEVVIALGVVAFSISAITGLLSIALQSSRASTDETLIASFSREIISDLRRLQLDAAWTALQDGTEVFFDNTGRQMNGLGSPIPPEIAKTKGAIYKCKISAISDPALRGTSGSENLLLVTLDFTWPQGLGVPLNRRIIHASLVRLY